MKKRLSFFLLVITLIACNTATSQTKNLAIDEFVKTYKNTSKAVLLDVRTPAEWAQGQQLCKLISMSKKA
jgi:hypothetical protein